jgi:hypothetical protein
MKVSVGMLLKYSMIFTRKTKQMSFIQIFLGLFTAKNILLEDGQTPIVKTKKIIIPTGMLSKKLGIYEPSRLSFISRLNKKT